MAIKPRFARLHAALGSALGAALALSMGAAPARASEPAEPVPQARADVFQQGLQELATADAALARRPDSLALRFNRMRILYVLGVKEKRYLADAEKEEAWLASRARDERSARLLLGYRGALRVAYAKHGFDLNRKWEDLKAGLPMLDSAVTLSPAQPELRYLRLVSNYYLPFFMGRKARVKEDFAALAELLPDAAGDFPPKWFLNVSGFVLENGKLDESSRRNLDRRTAQVRKELER
jgi:hypothetical protein